MAAMASVPCITPAVRGDWQRSVRRVEGTRQSEHNGGCRDGKKAGGGSWSAALQGQGGCSVVASRLIVASKGKTLEGSGVDAFKAGASRPQQWVNSRQRRGGQVPIRAGMLEVRELIISGKVKAWPPKRAGQLLQEGTEGWKLLDVRPIWERERAAVSGSLHVPLFVEDDDDSLLTALKRQIQFGFGGWWLGQKLTMRNESFTEQVQALCPNQDIPIMVACGEGLRSMLALEELHDAGYSKLAWVAGGLNNARDGDFAEVEGETELQFSTAGGLQGVIIKVGQYVNGLQSGAAPKA